MRDLNTIGGRGSHSFMLLSLVIMIAAILFSNFYIYSNYIALPLMAIWLMSIMRSKTVLSRVERSFVFSSLIIWLIIIMYKAIGISDINIGFIIRYSKWIVAGIISVYALKVLSQKELKSLFVYFTMILGAYIITVASLGQSLQMAQEEAEMLDVTSTWMGSLFMLISGFCLIVFINVKSLTARLVSAIFFLIMTYINFDLLQRGTTAVYTIGELALILAFSITNRKINRIVLPLAVIFTFIIVFQSDLLVLLFDWLADVVPSERLAKRFVVLSYFVQYGDIAVVDGSGSFASRAELMTISWNTFTSNILHFFFGAGAHRNDNTIIGNHSFFLDTLASYGIICGVIVFIYFFRQYQIMTSDLDRRKYYKLFMQSSVVFLFYVFRNFYGFLVTAQVNFVILIYFPLLINFLKISKYQNK